MKFVATKTVDQLDLQALHRVRERLVSQRTGVINQIRAFLLERGVAVRQGLRFLRVELPGILATRTDVLSPGMLRVIEDLTADWRRLDVRIEGLSSEIEAVAREDTHCERLMSVPGIGPIISSAMVAAIGNAMGSNPGSRRRKNDCTTTYSPLRWPTNSPAHCFGPSLTSTTQAAWTKRVRR
jgi:transposase